MSTLPASNSAMLLNPQPVSVRRVRPMTWATCLGDTPGER
jgi:hypothetical protein